MLFPHKIVLLVLSSLIDGFKIFGTCWWGFSWQYEENTHVAKIHYNINIKIEEL